MAKPSRLTEFFLLRPTFALLLVAAFVAAGALGYASLVRESTPDLEIPQATVVVEWPGGPIRRPSRTQVANELETELKSMEGAQEAAQRIVRLVLHRGGGVRGQRGRAHCDRPSAGARVRCRGRASRRRQEAEGQRGLRQQHAGGLDRAVRRRRRDRARPRPGRHRAPTRAAAGGQRGSDLGSTRRSGPRTAAPDPARGARRCPRAPCGSGSSMRAATSPGIATRRRRARSCSCCAGGCDRWVRCGRSRWLG